MSMTISIVIAISSLLAALFSIFAAVMPVPDNIDTFIVELQRSGWLSLTGGIFALVAALLSGGHIVLILKRRK